MHHLEELNFSTTKFGPKGFGLICRAMQSASFPHLRHIHLSSCGLSAVDGQALASLLWSQACPRIETLDLASNYLMGDVGVIPILKALEEGQCNSIRSLNLTSTGLTMAGGGALAQALSSSGCRNLHHLRLRHALTDRLSSLAVVKVLAEGSLPSLQSLDMHDTQMDDEHHHLLKQSPMCCMLKQLVC